MSTPLPPELAHLITGVPVLPLDEVASQLNRAWMNPMNQMALLAVASDASMMDSDSPMAEKGRSILGLLAMYKILADLDEAHAEIARLRELVVELRAQEPFDLAHL
jgi:hypothetical protein